MYHFVSDMDLTKKEAQVEMAEKIALNIIHEAYDCSKDKVCVSNEHLDRVYKASKILVMLKDIKNAK